jgi:predicted extracellular nuclease
MHLNKLVYFLTFTILCFWPCYQGNCQNRGDIRVMFYNTENFFDTKKDTINNDGDYTPEGKYHWTNEKYKHKLANTFKVIAGIGEWQTPEIIGLSEVENRQVLEDLLHDTPLSKYSYNIVHFDSPDPRGIDVALLYRSDKARVLAKEPIYIRFPEEPQRKTRNILFTQLLTNGDTLNIFVNHWPSRRGGELESEKYRICVASILQNKVDSLLINQPRAKIIIMGDFNDDPDNSSVAETLRAQVPFHRQIVNDHLYNLTETPSGLKKGTYCYKGQWQTFDQMIVSGNLLNSQHGLFIKNVGFHVYNAEFLLQADEKYAGMKPLPTYAGLKYMGGFSDHLPVYLDLFFKN